mgnify:CR=1 FL=1|tara:strand:+ start:77 stop:430 length:354 start_codon:yes stop_codon:yes gene_type:complete
MSFKERVVFLDRAAFTPDDLPIPSFEHNWSEYPYTEPSDLIPRLFWSTTIITHATPIDAEAVAQLHKLIRVIVTGPAVVDEAACQTRGIRVEYLPVEDGSDQALIRLLEVLVNAVEH